MRSWLRKLARRLGLRGSPRMACASATTLPSDANVLETATLRRALRQLLNQHPDTRRLMRHLGYVERSLARQGARALDEVPVEVLAKALAQLDGIVSNWSDRDLAELRSRLAVAIKQRSEDGLLGQAGAHLSDFATASRLLVGDVAHSVFEELQRQYQGLLPPERIQAVLAGGPAPASSRLPGHPG
jgi:hypothetical protein